MREAMTGQYQDYFVDSLKLSAVTAVIGGLIGTAAGARRRPVAATALAAQRGRRVRRRGRQHGRHHPGVRLHRRARHPGTLDEGDHDGWRRRPTAVHRLVLGPRDRLPLLPDPVDAARHAAGGRRAQARVAGGGGEPRWHGRDVLAPGRHPGARPGRARRDAAALRQRLRRLRHRLRPHDRGVEPRAAADPLLPPGQRDHRQAGPRVRPRGVDDPDHAHHHGWLPVAAPASRSGGADEHGSLRSRWSDLLVGAARARRRLLPPSPARAGPVLLPTRPRRPARLVQPLRQLDLGRPPRRAARSRLRAGAVAQRAPRHRRHHPHAWACCCPPPCGCTCGLRQPGGSSRCCPSCRTSCHRSPWWSA